MSNDDVDNKSFWKVENLNSGIIVFGVFIGVERGSLLLRVVCCNLMVSNEINIFRIFILVWSFII